MWISSWSNLKVSVINKVKATACSPRIENFVPPRLHDLMGSKAFSNGCTFHSEPQRKIFWRFFQCYYCKWTCFLSETSGCVAFLTTLIKELIRSEAIIGEQLFGENFHLAGTKLRPRILIGETVATDIFCQDVIPPKAILAFDFTNQYRYDGAIPRIECRAIIWAKT